MYLSTPKFDLFKFSVLSLVLKHGFLCKHLDPVTVDCLSEVAALLLWSPEVF